MKVLCKKNNLNHLDNKDLVSSLKKYIQIPDGEVDLILEREYVVYGIVFRENYPWYYLCAEDYDDYPKPYPAVFFETLNDDLSQYWSLSIRKLKSGEFESSLLIKEWNNIKSFYELLINEDERCIRIFKEYKSKMDLE